MAEQRRTPVDDPNRDSDDTSSNTNDNNTQADSASSDTFMSAIRVLLSKEDRSCGLEYEPASDQPIGSDERSHQNYIANNMLRIIEVMRRSWEYKINSVLGEGESWDDIVDDTGDLTCQIDALNIASTSSGDIESSEDLAGACGGGTESASDLSAEIAWDSKKFLINFGTELLKFIELLRQMYEGIINDTNKREVSRSLEEQIQAQKQKIDELSDRYKKMKKRTSTLEH